MNDEASRDQARWEEIARRLREALSARIDEVGAMTPDECKTLVDAVADARWLAVNAATHDKAIADMQAKLYCDP